MAMSLGNLHRAWQQQPHSLQHQQRYIISHKRSPLDKSMTELWPELLAAATTCCVGVNHTNSITRSQPRSWTADVAHHTPTHHGHTHLQGCPLRLCCHPLCAPVPPSFPLRQAPQRPNQATAAACWQYRYPHLPLPHAAAYCQRRCGRWGPRRLWTAASAERECRP